MLYCSHESSTMYEPHWVSSHVIVFVCPMSIWITFLCYSMESCILCLSDSHLSREKRIRNGRGKWENERNGLTISQLLQLRRLYTTLRSSTCCGLYLPSLFLSFMVSKSFFFYSFSDQFFIFWLVSQLAQLNLTFLHPISFFPGLFFSPSLLSFFKKQKKFRSRFFFSV